MILTWIYILNRDGKNDIWADLFDVNWDTVVSMVVFCPFSLFYVDCFFMTDFSLPAVMDMNAVSAPSAIMYM